MKSFVLSVAVEKSETDGDVYALRVYLFVCFGSLCVNVCLFVCFIS